MDGDTAEDRIVTVKKICVLIGRGMPTVIAGLLVVACAAAILSALTVVMGVTWATTLIALIAALGLAYLVGEEG